MVFAPDGTLYLADYIAGKVHKLPGTDQPSGPVTLVVDNWRSVDGMALTKDNLLLYGNSNDNSVRVFDLQLGQFITGNTQGAPGTVSFTPTSNTSHRGDLATVGPDGCYYGSDYGQIVKVTKADGTCDLFGPNPTPCPACNSAITAQVCQMLPTAAGCA